MTSIFGAYGLVRIMAGIKTMFLWFSAIVPVQPSDPGSDDARYLSEM